MKLSLTIRKIEILGIILAVGIALAPVLRAQQSDKTPPSQQDQTAKPEAPALPAASDLTKTQAEPPKVNPQEEADYKTFYETKPDAVDTEIQLGRKFLEAYPSSRYVETVNARLAQSYYFKQDWGNFYAYADKTISLNPDDVDILVLVGWVIPRSYNPNDLESGRRLDKAENYEKHALQLLQTLQKRPGITDEQFAAAKTMYLSQAHSGLGLVYFRRQNYADSFTELQQATTGIATPDPADYYVMGLNLQHLNRLADSADAFQKCGQISGPLQDRCKQLSEQVKKQATAPPAAPVPPKP